MSDEVQEQLGDILSAFGIPELAKHIVPIPVQPQCEDEAEGGVSDDKQGGVPDSVQEGEDSPVDSVMEEQKATSVEEDSGPSVGGEGSGGGGCHNPSEEDPVKEMDAKLTGEKASDTEEVAMETDDTSSTSALGICTDRNAPASGSGKTGSAEQVEPKEQSSELANCDLGLTQSVAPVTGDGSMLDSSLIRELLQQAKSKAVMTAVPQGDIPPPGQPSGDAQQWSSPGVPSEEGLEGTSPPSEPQAVKQPNALTSIDDLNAHFDRYKEAHQLAERKKDILGNSNCISPYKCPLLTDEQALALGLDKKTFSCPGCDDVFLFKASLDAHLDRRSFFITLVCRWCKGRKDLVFFNKCTFHAHFVRHKLSKRILGNVIKWAVITPFNALNSFQIYTRLSAAEKRSEEEDPSYTNDSGSDMTNAMKPLPQSLNVAPQSTPSQASKSVVKEAVKLKVSQIPSTAVSTSASVNAENGSKKVVTLWPPGHVKQSSPPSMKQSSSPSTKQSSPRGDATIQSEIQYKCVTPSEYYHVAPPTSTVQKEKPVCFISGFICMGCNERFDKRDKLRNHLQRIVSKGPFFQCRVCKMVLANGCMVKMHTFIHIGTSRFNLPCPECGSIFSNLKSLIIHESSDCLHWNRKPLFKCDFCHKYATSFQGLGRHFESNHMELFFKCPLCQLAFRSKDSASEHTLQVHRNRSVVFDMLYKCPFCKSVYSDRKLLESHFESHYRGGDIKIEKFVLTCFKCFKPFDHSGAVRGHVKTVHDAQCKMFTCDLCLGTMASVDVVLQHRIECSKGNVPVATMAKTIQPPLVIPHLKGTSLLSQKMFVCGECGEKFPHFSMEALRKHMLEKHTEHVQGKLQGKAPVQTQAASSTGAISTDSQVKIPVKKKEEQKVERFTDLTCGKCQHKSSDRVLFEKHIALHKSNDVHSQCHQCGLCFMVEVSLKRHLFIKHKIKDMEQFHKQCKEIVCKGEEEMKKRKQEEKEKERIREAEKAAAESDARKDDGEAVTPHQGTPSHNQYEDEEPQQSKCHVCGAEFENDKLLTVHKRSHGLAYLQHQLTRSPEKLAKAQVAKPDLVPPEQPTASSDVKDTTEAPTGSPTSFRIPSDTESSEVSEDSPVTQLPNKDSATLSI